MSCLICVIIEDLVSPDGAEVNTIVEEALVEFATQEARESHPLLCAKHAADIAARHSELDAADGS